MLTRIGIVLLIACMAGRALAEEQPDPLLLGITNFYLVVENVNPAGEKLGLTRDEIRTFAATTLRKAGLPLLRKEGRTRFTPYVYVQVVVASSEDVAAYSVRVGFYQDALLVKSAEIDKTYGKPMKLETWHTSVVGLRSGSGACEAIQKATIEEVGRFVAAYRLANPAK